LLKSQTSLNFSHVLPVSSRSCPWWLLRRPTSAPRLVAEAFVTALAVLAAVWAGCVAL